MSTLAVKVSPKASRNAVLGWHQAVLKLAVTAVPEHGQANAAVQALLAAVLELPKRAVQLQRGASSSQKLFVIEGLDVTEIRRRLDAAIAAA